MFAEDHFKIIGAIASRLEQVPGKARSEIGLNESQSLAIRRMIDEARETAASEVETMEGREV